MNALVAPKLLARYGSNGLEAQLERAREEIASLRAQLTKSRKPKAEKAEKKLMLVVDPRLPTNGAAHIEKEINPAKRANLTPARASKMRRDSMSACPCRLCALALTPAATFEENERFGLSAIATEAEFVWMVAR